VQVSHAVCKIQALSIVIIPLLSRQKIVRLERSKFTQLGQWSCGAQSFGAEAAWLSLE